VTLLVVADERCAMHFAGPGHPERPERVDALAVGLHDAERDGVIEHVGAIAATDAQLERVHAPAYVAAVRAFCLSGGGRLDADTAVVPESLEAALLAAGSGLRAVESLRAGEADAALCAVRPPGHHARPGAAMGFCMFNNVAVTAAALAAEGERVLIVDLDVHHGNGTQEAFWNEPAVAYVSIHQWPWYPGTGGADETGGDDAPGGILNVPLPAGATGDVYAAATDELIVPFAEAFAPDWLCLSLGFDAHRADPLAEIALSAGDFGRVVGGLVGLVPPGRCLAVFEGGYDLGAIAASTAATVAALTGRAVETEAATSGGPGRPVVESLIARRCD
jgi:acetoin utilization deacetylase AcuC-like enzyme